MEYIALVGVFVLGACIGSFLNVVVWRVPEGGLGALVSPRWSYCPKCKHQLSASDNIPIFGWFLLRGKCRYCKAPIAFRYPLVEIVTACLFAGYFALYFFLPIEFYTAEPAVVTDSLGATTKVYPSLLFPQHVPMYALYMFMVAILLSASLIDLDLFIIPPELPWIMAAVGVLFHGFVPAVGDPGALHVGPAVLALTIGGSIGLLISNILVWSGLMARSFDDLDLPPLDVHRKAAEEQGEDLPPPLTRKQLNAEMRKEMLFLMPPIALATGGLAAYLYLPVINGWFEQAASQTWLTGMFGAMLGAMVGALTIWLTRIFGSLGFGKEAMGLGDVHLMFGVGAIIGAGPTVAAFFLAPFCAILVAAWLFVMRKQRELPYGPYLSLGTALTMIFYSRIADYAAPGLVGLGYMFRSWLP